MIPKKVFFTKGIGVHKEKLASFELALRNAGIQRFNLVRVSSIFPPNCEVVSREKGLEELKPGSVVFCVMSEASSNEPNRLMATSIGLALPADRSTYGYLSEHHSYGETAKRAGDYAEDLAAEMLASTLDIQANGDLRWEEREQVYKMSGKIVRTSNITQSAEGDKDGKWTTVIAAAVFVF